MHFLLNSNFAPLLQRISFIETDLESAVKNFLDWMEPQTISDGFSVKVTPLKGNLKEVTLALTPLMYPDKRIFIPTRSNWVAFTDNLEQSEIGKIRQVGSRLNCRSLEVGAWEFNIANNPKQVNGWGGGFFTLNQNTTLLRSISLIFDDRWDFETHGSPLPFEDLEKYQAKRPRDRFTPEMLRDYCQSMGIDFFNEDFYMPEGSSAYLIEVVRPPWPKEQSESLNDVRQKLGWPISPTL